MLSRERGRRHYLYVFTCFSRSKADLAGAEHVTRNAGRGPHAVQAQYADLIKPQIGDHITATNQLSAAAAKLISADHNFRSLDPGLQEQMTRNLRHRVARASNDPQMGGGHFAALHLEYVTHKVNLRIRDRIGQIDRRITSIRSERTSGNTEELKPFIKDLRNQRTFLVRQIKPENTGKLERTFEDAIKIAVRNERRQLEQRSPRRVVCRVSHEADSSEVLQALSAIPADLRRNARIVSDLAS